MPQPNLIHPVWVVLELIRRDETVYDKYAREPVGQAIRQGESPRTGDRVRVKCQYSEYFASAKHDYPDYQREGVLEVTDSYVAFRYKDLQRKGLVEYSGGKWVNLRIQRGDRVVQIGRETVDLYVQGFKVFAHYPGISGAMLQVNLMDRHPTSQQGSL